ncbi:uncharacterized protein CIMG_13441 [Coccidioides immitis RS]|uniref:Uncharacterized protein n=2 Tax=Coccidioides TaxID=5500 RepID=J3KF37_COCIM|nr:uncharacterized protein CIMG_13441 [Coccidioides immitis RS]EAS34190.3 hypothetical protein CIMG_13441 [Coccidioides immitis RS]EFW17669.1 conserved hypothetical protein [Coccidioides posadasii str. Silveira]
MVLRRSDLGEGKRGEEGWSRKYIKGDEMKPGWLAGGRAKQQAPTRPVLLSHWLFCFYFIFILFGAKVVRSP